MICPQAPRDLIPSPLPPESAPTPARASQPAGNDARWEDDDGQPAPARPWSDPASADDDLALFFGGTPPTGHEPTCIERGRPMRAWHCPWCQRPLDARGEPLQRPSEWH